MFGLNSASLIGRLGGDVRISPLSDGGRVANLSVATDESYTRSDGERVDRAERRQVVTFEPGLIGVLERHARKGRLVYVSGKLRTRRWRKPDEGSDRLSTEIVLVADSRIQFLDRPAGTNGRAAAPDAANAAADAGTAQASDGEAVR